MSKNANLYDTNNINKHYIRLYGYQQQIKNSLDMQNQEILYKIKKYQYQTYNGLRLGGRP